MTDYLTGLVERALMPTTDVQPRVTPLFGSVEAGTVSPLPESSFSADDPTLEVEAAGPTDSPPVSWSDTRDHVVGHAADIRASHEGRAFRSSDDRVQLSTSDRQALPARRLPPSAADTRITVDDDGTTSMESAAPGVAAENVARRPHAAPVAPPEPPVVRRKAVQPPMEPRTQSAIARAAVRAPSAPTSKPTSNRREAIAPPPLRRPLRAHGLLEPRTARTRNHESNGDSIESAARNVRVAPPEDTLRSPHPAAHIVPAPAERSRQTAPSKEGTTQESSPAGGRTVHVTIGRLEVRVAPTAPARKLPRTQPPAMSLEDYVRARNGGGTR
jgi:hypothetical protein